MSASLLVNTSIYMGTRCVSTLRNHAHVLLIVPLVVIVMTWPTFRPHL